jgi:hypothetical protein
MYNGSAPAPAPVPDSSLENPSMTLDQLSSSFGHCQESYINAEDCLDTEVKTQQDIGGG